jgi:hypothetical protein
MAFGFCVTFLFLPFILFHCRLLPLYFPRDKHEEQVALSKLPADVGDENGETIIDERKIRIKPLPKKSVSRPPDVAVDLPVTDIGLVQKLVIFLKYFVDFSACFIVKINTKSQESQDA